MAEDKNKKVLECKASDNFYLHKDFHGALCYSIKYLEDKFGPEAVKEFLQQVGETYFAPLSEKLKQDGLAAIEKHFTEVMNLEQGEYTFSYEGEKLVLKVNKCPAVAHLKKIDFFFTDSFCESTAVVNDTICRNAGYRCSCEYEKGRGKCVQKFWKG